MAKQVKQTNPVSTPAAKSVKVSTPIVFTENPIYKKLFLALSVALLIVLPLLSFQFGITGDERFYEPYGKSSLHFYETFGKDTSALFVNTGDGGKLHCYGPSVELFNAFVTETFHVKNNYEFRHFVNSIIAFLLFVFTGLLVVEMAGWRAGLIALLLLVFSPRILGDSMNNPRDPSFAAFYIFAAFFMLRMLRTLPKPSWKNVAGLAIGIGLAIGSRIGAILLIAYTGLFALIEIWMNEDLRKNMFGKYFKDLALRFGVAFIGGYIIGILFWPFGLVAPIAHPKEALDFFTNVSYTIKTLFEGKKIGSGEVPWYYVPKWISISAPEIVLFGIVLFACVAPFLKKHFNWRLPLYIAFMGVFPVAYIIYKKSGLYNGWRHTTFVYAPLVACAAIAYEFLFRTYTDKKYQIALWSVIGLGLLLPASWLIKNHPNETTYFNQISGGIDAAYGQYETDYFGNSIKQGADWLKANVDLSDTNLVVATNFPQLLTKYPLQKKYPKREIGFVRYAERAESNWDYYILTTQLIEPSLFTNKNIFPPSNAIHVIKVDNTPVCLVLKRGDKSDYLGYQALKKNDFPTAISLFERYLKTDPNNEAVLANLGTAYLNAQRVDDAQRVLSQAVNMYPGNLNAMYMLGLSYFYKNDYNNCILTLQNLLKDNQYFAPPYQVLAQCYAKLGDNNQAQYMMGIYQQLAQQQ